MLLRQADFRALCRRSRHDTTHTENLLAHIKLRYSSKLQAACGGGVQAMLEKLNGIYVQRPPYAPRALELRHFGEPAIQEAVE